MWPQAYIVGCSYSDFWHGDTQIFFDMVRGFQEKRKFESLEWQRKTEVESWIQGHYVATAIGCILPGGEKYPQTPLKFFADSLETQTAQDKQAMTNEEINVRNAFERARSVIGGINDLKKQSGSRPA